jgi:hypothetical protein
MSSAPLLLCQVDDHNCRQGVDTKKVDRAKQGTRLG